MNVPQLINTDVLLCQSGALPCQNDRALNSDKYNAVAGLLTHSNGACLLLPTCHWAELDVVVPISRLVQKYTEISLQVNMPSANRRLTQFSVVRPACCSQHDSEQPIAQARRCLLSGTARSAFAELTGIKAFRCVARISANMRRENGRA